MKYSILMIAMGLGLAVTSQSFAGNPPPEQPPVKSQLPGQKGPSQMPGQAGQAGQAGQVGGIQR